MKYYTKFSSHIVQWILNMLQCFSVASRIGRPNKERPFVSSFAVQNGNTFTDVVHGTVLKVSEGKIINLSPRELQIQGLMHAGCKTPTEVSQAIFQQTGETVAPEQVSNIMARLRLKLA